MITDMFAQFGFMLYCNSFFWFGHFWPFFDIIKTVINILSFLYVVLTDYGSYTVKDKLNARNYQYYITLLNTILTGICSIVVGTSIYLDNVKNNKDMGSIYFYIVLFIFGYPFQIYCTYIVKEYCKEIPEFKDEMTELTHVEKRFE